MSAFLPLPITAFSTVSALGATRADVGAALREGRTGLAAPPSWFPHPTRCGAVPIELAPLPERYSDYECRQARLALAVLGPIEGPIAAALERWGASRVALILGTSTGGIDRTEAALDAHRESGGIPADYDMLKQHNFYAFTELLKQVTGVEGPSYVISTACSSSAKVFASAARLIAADLADAVIVGGVDTLAKTTLFGFHSLSILAPELCRPFGENRPGINIGEGGTLLLLEREGEHKTMLLGVGESSDAHHMTSPHPEGAGAYFAMERALQSAGLQPADVDHINAHGTGTPHNDASESTAIARMFGTDVPVVSTKGYTGHTLGAAGGIEAAFSLIALEEQWLPASLGAEPIDPAVEVNIVTEARDARLRTVLSNSFGFGGNNCSVLFGVGGAS